MRAEVGVSASLDHVVGESHTAVAVGSGDVEVLGTPTLLAWCEAATVAAVAPLLDTDETTVGSVIQLEHRRPTPVGGSVSTAAVLTGVDGRRLTFDVSATDGDGPIATGSVVRVLVDRTRFIEGLARG